MSTKKRSARESGIDTKERKDAKRRKKSYKSRHDDSDSDSYHRSKHKHKSKKKSKKSKHKKRKYESDSYSESESFSDDSTTNKPESKFIDHPKWKYLRISSNDYYKYYTEFSDWALKEKSKYLDEMNTKKRKKLFKKFMNKWNDGKLAEKYYKTFTSLSIDNKQKTRYKWSFEKNIDSKEQMKMDLIRDQIDNETNDQIIVDQVVQRFQRRFERKRERDRNNNNKGRRGRGRNGKDGDDDDMEFENDNDGIDARKKMERQQEEREKQRRQDRKKRIKDIKQRKYEERQERDKQLLSSYQSFISSSPKSSKKRKK